MPILITGGTGLLGKALLSTVPREVQPAATYYGEPPPNRDVTLPFCPLDIRDVDAVARLFDEFRPNVVIHTASIGSVDYAEQHREEAWAVNVSGTRNVAEACRRHGAKLVFISSNAVFDGQHPPYAEEDVLCPLNYYGELKVAGEQVVQETLDDAAIVRPIVMYGWPNPGERGNLVTYWLDRLGRGEQIRAVDDVWSKPLQVENCAEVCWAIVAQDRVDVYHAAGADRVSLYEFALQVTQTFGFDADRIIPVPSSHFPQMAIRPKETSFVTDKMERVLGVRPVGLVEGLRRLKARRPAQR